MQKTHLMVTTYEGEKLAIPKSIAIFGTEQDNIYVAAMDFSYTVKETFEELVKQLEE